jgi:hypothetical protein
LKKCLSIGLPTVVIVLIFALLFGFGIVPTTIALTYSKVQLLSDFEPKNKTLEPSKVYVIQPNKTNSTTSKISSKLDHPQLTNISNGSVPNKSSLITTHQLAANDTNMTLNLKDGHTNPNPWLSPFTQFMVSGLVSGLALFIANIALDKYRRPCLSINKEIVLEPVLIDISLYQINIPNFSKELSEYKVQYWANRVTIRNNGRNAAENCKGILKINNREEKICWYVPSERYKMTINADSEEYLDVCAVLLGDAKEIFDRLNQHIESKFGTGPEGSEARSYVKSNYRTYEDIPVIIVPTENGWHEYAANLNRKIIPCPATIIVTGKNTRPSLKQNITILDKPKDKGLIIEWK